MHKNGDMPTHASIRAVCFDVGGVLTTPFSEVLGALIGSVDVDWSQVGPTLRTTFASDTDGDEPTHRLERGEISIEEFFTTLGPVEVDARRLLDPSSEHFVIGRLAPSAVMHELLADVRAAGFKVGLLSNVVTEWLPSWHSFAPATQDVDDIVYSCEVGLRKPNPAIYRLAAERLNVALNEVLFLDDFPAMVEAAAEVGMNALHVTSHVETASLVRTQLGIAALNRETIPRKGGR